MNHTVQPYISKRVLVLGQDIPADVAARAMAERHCGSVVVSDSHGHIVGLVTDRDLSTQVLAYNLSAKVPLSEVMTSEIIVVDSSASITDVANVMATHGVRRIPVVDTSVRGRQKCVGMITLDDLIASQAVNSEVLSRVVRAQIRRQLNRPHNPFRSEEKREQTLRRFDKTMAVQMALPKQVSERVSFHLLKEIVKRLSYTEASHFISQLPSLLHEDLLNLPAGPDLRVNRESVLQKLIEGFQMDRVTAEAAAKSFWRGLELTLDDGVMFHVIAQLPEDLRELFGALTGKETQSLPQAAYYHETNIDISAFLGKE